MDKLAPTVHAQSGGGYSGDFQYDEVWGEPRNPVGMPRNRVMDASRIGPVCALRGTTLVSEYCSDLLSAPGLTRPQKNNRYQAVSI